MLVPLKSLFGLTAFDEPVPPGSSRDVALLLAENPHLTAAFEHAQPAAPGSKPDTQAPEPSYTPTVTPMPGM